MGILGTDYTIRTGQVIFLLLVASSVLLGFSYLNEMYQRIQLQEKMEIQMQHVVAQRTIMQRKAFLLQTQMENRNKEMKRMQDIHEFQTQQRNSICEKEMNDLQKTVSSKDDTITEVQNQYESLKKRFEHLQSVMKQFEKNQSTLLEKFSSQSTQCMNVINKLSELCNKGNILRKISQVTKQNVTFIKRPITQSSTLVNATISTLLVSPSQDSYKTNGKYSTEFSSSLTRGTPPHSDDDKQSSLNAVQIQEMVSELNNTKDNEDKVIKLEERQNSTEYIFKSRAEEGEKDDEKYLPKNITIEKTAKSKTNSTKQQTRKNETLLALKETLEFEILNQTKVGNVSTLQYPMSLSDNESLPLINQDNRTTDDDVFPIEKFTNGPVENITMAEDIMESKAKTYDTGKSSKGQDKPQRLTLKKIKTPDRDIYKAEEESDYEDNNDVDKELEFNDKKNLETIF